jgi:hypothetical protein
MTLVVKDHNRFPWTRADAKKMAKAFRRPDAVDFTGIASISHCFADELFSQFADAPKVINASPFVARIVHSVNC